MLLLRALQVNGLKPTDIVPIYLAPAEGRAAFESGAVDGWVAFDPYLANVQHSSRTRVIQDGQGLSPNYQFYFASEALTTKRPDVVNLVLSEIKTVDEYASKNFSSVAKQLAPLIGMDESVVITALQRMGYGISPVTSEITQSQQKIADMFYEVGLIPKPVRVEAVIWKPN